MIKKIKTKIGGALSGAVGALRGRLYDLSVRFHGKFRRKKTKQRLSGHQRGAKFFYASIMILPMAQFLIFYVFVNINSVVMSVQEFSFDSGKFTFLPWDNLFGNFEKFALDLVRDPILISATKNSFLLYACTLCIGLPLNLVFSYFLYKKVPMANMFRVVLFLPHIVSAMIISLMFKFFVEKAVPGILAPLGITNASNLITRQDTAFKVIIFYVLWSGFGTQILVYTSTMSRISDSIIEAGRLEGITLFKEFFRVILPLIFPTITTFLVIGVAGIFTSQGGLYDFFGGAAPYHAYTFGYFLFVRVIGEANINNYPYAAAAGLLFTIVAAPVTILVKYLLERFGPSAEY